MPLKVNWPTFLLKLKSQQNKHSTLHDLSNPYVNGAVEHDF